MKKKLKVKKIKRSELDIVKVGGMEIIRERKNLHETLLANIKNNMPILESLLEEANSHWQYEDAVYRYYHGSFKVYYIQDLTKKMFIWLKWLSPHDLPLNRDYLEILEGGIHKVFDISHNQAWSKHCRPLLEAFFHTKYFLEMAVKYGKEMKKAPEMLPSGWAGLLYLYNIR